MECREALAFPGEPQRAVILRRLLPLSGITSVAVRLEPRSGYGKQSTNIVGLDGQGGWIIRTGSLWMRWTGAAAATEDNGTLVLIIQGQPGQRHDFALEIAKEPFRGPAPDPSVLWDATEHAWHQDVPELARSAAQRDTEHAYAILRGLSASTGELVAAATTSLPERARAGRNFDYRYAWMRDQCYAGMALASIGDSPLLDRIIGFVRDRVLEDGPNLRPAYTVAGEPLPAERKLDLPGYPGGERVVAGNHAGTEFQLDAFAETLLLFAAAADRQCLDAQGWTAAIRAADAIGARWTQADSGVWELGAENWTHSRLICVAGLRRIAGQPGGGLP